MRRLGRSGVERRQWAAHRAFMPLPGFQDAALDPTRTEIGNVVGTALLSGRASRECPHPGAGRRPPRPVDRAQGFVIAAEVPVNAGSTEALGVDPLLDPARGDHLGPFLPVDETHEVRLGALRLWKLGFRALPRLVEKVGTRRTLFLLRQLGRRWRRCLAGATTKSKH